MKYRQGNKFLFVTYNDVDNTSYGGGQCSSRNVAVLGALGQVVLYPIFKKSTIGSLKSALAGNFPPFTNADETKILSLLRDGDFTCVFLDSTLFGNLVRKIKLNFTIPIISFCHNVEIDYIAVRFGKNPIRYLYKALAWKSEKIAMRFSDKVIVLTERDKRRVLTLYNRDAEYILPITFDATLDTVELERKYKLLANRQDQGKVCLFVGSLGHSKLEGITWFVDNVAPFINAKVMIVGKGFDTVSHLLSRDNVEVLGYVNDLEKVYLGADCVIVPILSGAGMKVKVAEALMYGKSIFGTPEAFVGYELDFEQVGGVCKLSSEFVFQLNTFLNKSSKYNAFSRQQFDALYTNNIAYNCFKRILSSL